jgi:hypothetical protein
LMRLYKDNKLEYFLEMKLQTILMTRRYCPERYDPNWTKQLFHNSYSIPLGMESKTNKKYFNIISCLVVTKQKLVYVFFIQSDENQFK